MNKFELVDIKECDMNPFNMIGRDWMLVTAEKEGKVNTLTASWGGLGVIWGKNVAYVFIRDSRYTKEFIDGSDSFSLSFFDTSKYKKDLAYLGTVSGRDQNKIENVGFTVNHEDGVPYFDEAEVVITCRKMSCHKISPEGFIDKTVDDKWYGDKDYHNMYIGEITHILKKK